MRRHYSEMLSDEPQCKRANNTSWPVNLNPGEILTDLSGRQWKLGRSVGVGGFGEIFLISDNLIEDVGDDALYVVKVESHHNGPLFVEINCYLRIARREVLHQWKEEKDMNNLGMPHYVASGSHTVHDTKYRFLIIPRFDKDLENMFKSKKFKFNLKTVLTISLQVLDILQYIHNKGYVHSDIKASNILLKNRKSKMRSSVLGASKTFIRYHGFNPIRTCRVRKLNRVTRNLRPNGSLRSLEDMHLEDNIESSPDGNKDQVYLLDYGLASKYRLSSGQHKEFCSDERKAHAGTILFCSRDAHEGAQSRRSDLESLGYNMIYWLTSHLPWYEKVEEPVSVAIEKQRCLRNIHQFLNSCFDITYPRFLFDYFAYIRNLAFEEEPDYNYCKSLFRDALNEYGYKDNSCLDFDNLEGWGKKERQLKGNLENKKTERALHKVVRSPLKSNLPGRPSLRKRKTKSKKKSCAMDWSKILIDPEEILKQGKSRDRKLTESSDSNPANGIMNLDIDQLNPTCAMLEVYNRTVDRMNNFSGTSPRCRGDSLVENIEGYTAAMVSVYNRKKEREEYEQMVLNANSTRRTPRNQKKKNVSKTKTQVSPVKIRSSKSFPVLKKDSLRKIKTQERRGYTLRG